MDKVAINVAINVPAKHQPPETKRSNHDRSIISFEIISSTALNLPKPNLLPLHLRLQRRPKLCHLSIFTDAEFRFDQLHLHWISRITISIRRRILSFEDEEFTADVDEFDDVGPSAVDDGAEVLARRLVGRG